MALADHLGHRLLPRGPQLGVPRVGGEPGDAAEQERAHGERAELGGGPPLGDQVGQDVLAPVGVDQREPGQVADPRRAHRRPRAGQLRQQQHGEQDGLQHPDDHRRRREPGDRGHAVDHVVDQRDGRADAPVPGPLHPVVEVRVVEGGQLHLAWSGRTAGSPRPGPPAARAGPCAQPAAAGDTGPDRRRGRDQDQRRQRRPHPARVGPPANSACSTRWWRTARTRRIPRRPGSARWSRRCPACSPTSRG